MDFFHCVDKEHNYNLDMMIKFYPTLTKKIYELFIVMLTQVLSLFHILARWFFRYSAQHFFWREVVNNVQTSLSLVKF